MTLLLLLVIYVAYIGLGILDSLFGTAWPAIYTALNNYVALHYSASQMSFLHCFYGIGVSLSPYLLSHYLTGNNDWRGGFAGKH